MCPKVKYKEWYDHACLFGNCLMCRMEKLTLCFKEVIGSLNDAMQWRWFALETTMARNDQTSKKLTLVCKTTTIDEFVNYLKTKLQHFVKHNCCTMGR